MNLPNLTPTSFSTGLLLDRHFYRLLQGREAYIRGQSPKKHCHHYRDNAMQRATLPRITKQFKRFSPVAFSAVRSARVLVANPVRSRPRGDLPCSSSYAGRVNSDATRCGRCPTLYPTTLNLAATIRVSSLAPDAGTAVKRAAAVPCSVFFRKFAALREELFKATAATMRCNVLRCRGGQPRITKQFKRFSSVIAYLLRRICVTGR